MLSSSILHDHFIKKTKEIGPNICELVYTNRGGAKNFLFVDLGQCRNCTCKLHGIVECVERQCPYCEEPIYTPNSCCPQCQDKTKYLLEGNGHTVFMDNVYFTQPMTIYLLLIGLALLILCTCVVCSVLLGKCFYKRVSIHLAMLTRCNIIMLFVEKVIDKRQIEYKDCV
jgi:hypothetical protein